MGGKFGKFIFVNLFGFDAALQFVQVGKVGNMFDWRKNN